MQHVSVIDRPVTRTEWVEDQIRQMILLGDVLPGHRLVLATIAERLGVSVSPVREALARLSKDQLVDLTPHGSATVAAVSCLEAAEVYDMRLLVEPCALARAIVAATDSDAAAWVDAYQHLDTGTTRLENLRFHARFHRSIVSSCPSAWMLKTVIPLQDYAMRMVAAASTELAEDYSAQADHRRLLDACLERRADDAAAELTTHLERSADSFRPLKSAHLDHAPPSTTSSRGREQPMAPRRTEVQTDDQKGNR